MSCAMNDWCGFACPRIPGATRMNFTDTAVQAVQCSDPVTIVGPKQDGNGFTTPSYKRNTIGVNSGVEHYG